MTQTISQFDRSLSVCHIVTVRCQGCDPGHNGLASVASCLMGRHPVPGLATPRQLSRNKWGNHWSGKWITAVQYDDQSWRVYQGK